MKITILNGNDDAQNIAFDAYLAQLAQTLIAGGHAVNALALREMDIHYCVGCWGCWVKTPGECVQRDDSAQVARAVINADFVLWASPLVMGFPSALLKTTIERTIALLHPYFEIEYGEFHHRGRYDRYPVTGLLLGKEEDTDDEDLAIVTDVLARTALNKKSRLAFSLCTDRPAEEAARAITAAPTEGELFKLQLPPTIGVHITPPTRLTVFNGSPRGATGGTPFLLEQFLKGFEALPGHTHEMYHLSHLQEAETFRRAYAEAECVWLGFPLYTDAMPGIVKAFIETLAPLRGRPGNPPIGFLVQSGFPEATHSRHIEQYLPKLAARLGSPYLGAIVRGSCEGVRHAPEKMIRPLCARLEQLGRTFGEQGRLDPALLRSLAQPERFPGFFAGLFKLLTKTSLPNGLWDGQLRQNGAMERRDARPYLE